MVKSKKGSFSNTNSMSPGSFVTGRLKDPASSVAKDTVWPRLITQQSKRCSLLLVNPLLGITTKTGISLLCYLVKLLLWTLTRTNCRLSYRTAFRSVNLEITIIRSVPSKINSRESFNLSARVDSGTSRVHEQPIIFDESNRLGSDKHRYLSVDIARLKNELFDCVLHSISINDTTVEAKGLTAVWWNLKRLRKRSNCYLVKRLP